MLIDRLASNIGRTTALNCWSQQKNFLKLFLLIFYRESHLIVRDIYIKITLYVPVMQFCWLSCLPKYCYVY